MLKPGEFQLEQVGAVFYVSRKRHWFLSRKYFWSDFREAWAGMEFCSVFPTQKAAEQFIQKLIWFNAFRKLEAKRASRDWKNIKVIKVPPFQSGV